MKPNVPAGKMSKCINIKDAWKEMALSSTSHGLPNILRSDRILDILSTSNFDLLFLFDC